jgi:hypothetical protein
LTSREWGNVNLVSLAEYKNREVVAVLRELTQLAEKGQARGLAFVVKVGRRGGHRLGLVGDYRRNPDEALGAAVRLKEMLLQDPDDEEESGT